MQDSIFTKIIKGEIPCHKVYEDADTFAFLDINPTQPGHTLVIPKAQVPFVWDLNDELYGKLMATAKKVALHLREALGVQYVGSRIIGEEVPHAHIHLVPFNVASEYYQLRPANTEPDHKVLAAMAQKLRMEDEL